MSLLERLKTSAFWLTLPAIAVAVLVGTAMASYEPLTFDSSLYEAQTAEAAELEEVDAEAIEAEHASDEAADVQLASAPSSVGSELADGSWTGYAACGKGNSDGWKPYYVGVTLTVANGSVKSIDKIFGSSAGNAGDSKLAWDASENQKYLDWAISGRNGATGVRAQISGASVASGIDTVSGATYSSAAIFNAYVDALSKSAAAAGSALKTPDKADSSKGSKDSGKDGPGKIDAEDPTAGGALVDGSWTGYAACGPDPNQDWKPYYVGVTLTVQGGKVASVDEIFGSSTGDAGSAQLTWDASENQEYLDGAVSGVGEQIKEAARSGTVATTVDVVSGATYSSKAIFNAYYAALGKSAAAGGATVEAPSEPTAEPAPGSGSGGAGAGAGEGDAAGDSFYGFAYCSSSGSDSWDPYYLFVEVKAEDGTVTGISKAYADEEGLVDPEILYSASQNGSYLAWAVDGKFGGTGYRMKSVVKQIQAKIDAGTPDDVSGISTVSGATRSSKSILEAYKMAVANAAAGVGKTPEEAVAAAASEVAAG